MSDDWNVNLAKTPMISGRAKRSGKTLVEIMQELGLNVSKPRHQSSEVTRILQHVVLKSPDTRLSNLVIMTPDLNLGQIIYYQPEVVVESAFPDKVLYKIERFKTTSIGLQKYGISDIEVKSFKPLKKVKFRKRKRHSSTILKVEEILNRGKPNLPSRESQESIYIEQEEEQEVLPKTIFDLPENVLKKIFLWLDQKERVLILPRVCKLWYGISKDPIFWMELEFKGNKVSKDVIIELLKKYPKLIKLRLTALPDIVEILQELSRCNDDIEELGIRHCTVSSLDFSRIILHVISCCTNLKTLDLKGMKFQSERFYLKLGRLKNLQRINLTGNTLLRNHDLITLAVNCPSLQDLRILDINLSSAMETTLKDEDLIFITSHLRTLTTLKMDMHRLGNTSYQAILKCSRLHCLALKNCLMLTSDVFRQFPMLKNLKSLKITRAINLKADDFHHVFSTEPMRNIQKLDLNGCWNVGENGIRAIGLNLRKLEVLSLKNCKSIRKKDLFLLLQNGNLSDLNIAHTGIDFANQTPTPEYFKNLKILVIAMDVPKKTLKHFSTAFPSLTIKLSCSEFQKDERIYRSF